MPAEVRGRASAWVLVVLVLSMPLDSTAQSRAGSCQAVLADAEPLMAAQDHAEAARRLEPCIGSEQLGVFEQVRVLRLLARARYAEGDLAPGVATLETLARFYPDATADTSDAVGHVLQAMLTDVHKGMSSTDVIVRHWRRQGDQHFAAGRYPQAAAAYERAVDLRPDDAETMERFKLASAFDEQGVALTFDVGPTIQGGIQALYRELTYPEEALRMAIEGRVVARIVVTADGTPGAVEILRGLGHGCDDEVRR
ncbi:MAG: tetratricopeptide repeat protein, partial [Bacteroidetes bacterium]|nr:tetratricopeptide repeat protein [Bacteroidota bacterium]